jgi:hypothetical protein
MGFKAAEAVSQLEWDFRPYVDAHGVSPEPSGLALFAFQQNYFNTTQAFRKSVEARARAQAEELRSRTSEELADEMARWSMLTWDEAIEETDKLLSGSLGKQAGEELHQRLAELVAEVTGGCPSAEQIMDLPGRVRSGYLGWFIGQVTDPEFEAAGMTS